MSKTLHTIYVGSFFLVGIAVMVLLTIHGFEYYSTPVEDRPFLIKEGEQVFTDYGEPLKNPKHSTLKPSGTLGHGFGIVGTLMMTFGVAIYMIRKRSKRLLNWGYLKHWLEFHIFLCSVGPLLILYHTSFKFGGIVSVSFWSMVAVVASGVIGRFIYVQIPRTIQGKELSYKDLNEMNEEYSQKLKTEFTVSEKLLSKLESYSSPEKYKRVKLGTSFIFLLKDYFGIKSVMKGLKKEIKNSGLSPSEIKAVLITAKDKLILTRRIGLLRTTQKLFKYWHIVHLPFAITMFVIMLIHVAVTIIFGYKWIF